MFIPSAGATKRQCRRSLCTYVGIGNGIEIDGIREEAALQRRFTKMSLFNELVPVASVEETEGSDNGGDDAANIDAGDSNDGATNISAIEHEDLDALVGEEH